MTGTVFGHAARFLSAITIGKLKLVDDSGPVQLVQVSEGTSSLDGTEKLLDRVARVSDFGFTSSPPIDSDVVLTRDGANRTMGMGVGTNHPASRLKNLAEGDSALYDQRGAYVWLTPLGVDITGSGGRFLMRDVPGGAVVEGSLSVDGNLASGTGATGSFTTPTGDTVVVQDGIITNIF